MGRPTEFDVPAARGSAMMLFWRKGYLATSLSDLLEDMGIARGSLYAAFGDKRRLFIECLDLFAAQTHEVLVRARARHPPLEALRRFLERSFVRANGAQSDLGCMLVNTVIELAGVDDELSARASRHLADLQASFEACLGEAGYSPARATELAAFLMMVNEGLRVSSRRNLPRKQHLDRLDTVFHFLKSQPA